MNLFQRLLQTYSQRPIDADFLQQLGFVKFLLSGNPFVQDKILSYLEEEDLLPLSYFLPFVRDFLLKKIKEKLRHRYGLQCQLSDKDTFWLYDNLNILFAKETVKKAALEGRLDIIKCIVNSNLKIYLFSEVANNAIKSGNVELVKYLRSVNVPIDRSIDVNYSFQNLELFQEYLSQLPITNDNIIIAAINAGKSNVLNYLFMNGNPLRQPDKLYERVTEKLNEDIITILEKNNVLPTPQGMSNLLMNGDVETFNYFLSRGILPLPEASEIAAKNGDVDILKSLLSMNIYSPAFITNGLKWAIQNGHLEMIKYLWNLNILFPLDIEDANNAAKHGFLDLLQALVAKGIYPNNVGLIEAVNNGHLPVVKYLLDNGIAPDISMLNNSAKSDYLDILKLLVDKGIRPTIETLDVAVKSRKDNVIKYLLENGNVPDTYVIEEAAMKSNLEIFKLLVKGKNVRSNILNIAIKNQNDDVVKFLLENGIRPDTKSVNLASTMGNLHLLQKLAPKVGHFTIDDGLRRDVENGYLDVVEFLLNYGPKASININLSSLADVAARRGHLDILKLFVSKEIPPTDEALRKAIYNNRIEVVKYLLKLGFVPNAEDIKLAFEGNNIGMVYFLEEKGFSFDQECLDIAIQNGNIELVDLLLEKGLSPSQHIVNDLFNTQGNALMKNYLKPLISRG